MQNKIQEMAGAVSGVMEGVRYIFSETLDGYVHVPNLNCNSDGDFKLNLNNWDGDWNDNYCVLVFRNVFIF